MMTGERQGERKRIARILRDRLREMERVEPEDQDAEAMLSARYGAIETIENWLRRGARPGDLWL